MVGSGQSCLRLLTRARYDPANGIGLAVIGCGPIGHIRAELACAYPDVGWIGVSDTREDLARSLANDLGADFWTTSADELIARPEVNATVVATNGSAHVAPTMGAIEQGRRLFIEKSLAVDVHESEQVLRTIEAAGYGSLPSRPSSGGQIVR